MLLEEDKKKENRNKKENTDEKKSFIGRIKEYKKGGWEMGETLVIGILLVIILCVVIFVLCSKKNKIHDSGRAAMQERRTFSKDDRKAVLLMQELADIIKTVEGKARK